MRWLCVLFSMCLAVQVFAWRRQNERTWHVKGKPVKATQYAVSGDKVHLYTLEDWPEPRVVSISDLSRADQEYIKTEKGAEVKQGARPSVCPMLNVKISVDIGKKTSHGQGVEMVAKVEPPGGEPYDGKVDLNMLLVGKEPGTFHYTVVGAKALPFRIPNGEPFEIDFKFNLGKTKGTTSIPKYAGYLVVVSDETGRQVALEGYPSAFKKNAGKLLAFSEGDRFDQRFEPVP